MQKFFVPFQLDRLWSTCFGQPGMRTWKDMILSVLRKRVSAFSGRGPRARDHIERLRSVWVAASAWNRHEGASDRYGKMADHAILLQLRNSSRKGSGDSRIAPNGKEMSTRKQGGAASKHRMSGVRHPESAITPSPNNILEGSPSRTGFRCSNWFDVLGEEGS